MSEALTCSSRRAALCEVWGFCLPVEPQKSPSSGLHKSDGSTQSLLTPRSGWCSFPPPRCEVSQANHFLMQTWDKWCTELSLSVLHVCLPFVCLQGSLFHFLRTCRERQQSLALDLAWHHEHIGLEGLNMTSDILGHYLWPFTLVPTVWQQWHDNLEAYEETFVTVGKTCFWLNFGSIKWGNPTDGSAEGFA